ncbi:MAG TPA: type VI secretion system protein TssA, partial [Burkholderiaceae bacterium]|nr:type VI secretion system protein TssA [Burkholderiaceae bacterium]
EPADWPAVHERVLALLPRTRDLRLAVMLARCQARLHGLGGYAQGLALVRGLLERHWDHVHPQLDPGDGNDPTMRMNVLVPLSAADAGLLDLRAAALSPVRGSLTTRDVELAFVPASAAAGETVPSEAGLLAALERLVAEHPQTATDATAVHEAVQAIDARLQAQVGAAQAPELAPLLALTGVLARAVARASGKAADATHAPTAAGVEGVAATALGTIRNRSDAARELGRVCEWIERNEPSNPAPLLIRRAQRLMDKTFLEIIRDLAPDGLGQVERIAGTEASS